METRATVNLRETMEVASTSMRYSQHLLRVRTAYAQACTRVLLNGRYLQDEWPACEYLENVSDNIEYVTDQYGVHPRTIEIDILHTFSTLDTVLIAAENQRSWG